MQTTRKTKKTSVFMHEMPTRETLADPKDSEIRNSIATDKSAAATKAASNLCNLFQAEPRSFSYNVRRHAQFLQIGGILHAFFLLPFNMTFF